MNNELIKKIKHPNDIKQFKNKDLVLLAQEIRELLIETAKTNEIHFSSNLGIVELTMMVLKVFDINKDKILYDTGHQTYVHKILTGRYKQFPTIRKEGSLTGFMNMNESKFDHYSPGHSGNILSVASGMYQSFAKDNKMGKRYINNQNIITIIGDSAFANGLNFEALNDVSFNKEPIIIILNDNDMSISKPVGHMSKVFSKIKNSWFFHFIERAIRLIFNYNRVYFWIYNSYYWIQWRITGKNLFENLGYQYIGPVDGHNIKSLENALSRAKWFAKQGPVIVHVRTKKGKGVQEAENDCCGSYHSSSKSNNKTYGMYVTDKLLELMKDDKSIMVINPAMSNASNCQIIQNEFPNRYFDVGISEEHAISKAGGMSLVGLKPYIYMYSSFLQRTYDQLLHDISRLSLNCTLLIDRADLSGGDGSSHHGIYDVGFLKTIHDVVITSPRDIKQLNTLLEFSHQYNESIFAIRYPKTDILKLDDSKDIKFGEWEQIYEPKQTDAVIISYGPYINSIYKNVCEKYNIALINAVFITKYNPEQLDDICKKYQNIIIYERIFGNNGINLDLNEFITKNHLKNNLYAMHYKSVVEGGSTDALDKRSNMHYENIIELLRIKLIIK